ncbi:unnamed protein product [Chrysodeixis includens]|uniref:Uncharacterized protein n=1 Tax=Chrysodeixis includens TaxID=689277 RepID=A0A9N8Q0Z7_CHRIL|nr:unnamed protein product [Chrysodeixis includens]
MLAVVGSNHLVMQTAKNVLYGDSKNLQPWGLIILLLSKSVKTPTYTPQMKKNEEQTRVLAELTEMMRTGHLIHRGIVNVPFAKRSKNTESAIFGNKIAILLGDYLLVTANGMLANLRNSDVSYIISTALKDLSEDNNPNLYKVIAQAKNDVKDVDYEDLKFNILKTDAVDKTKMLYEEHAKKATEYIEGIAQNESVDMIKKLINTF